MRVFFFLFLFPLSSKQISILNWEGLYGNLCESIKFRLWLAWFTISLKLQELDLKGIYRESIYPSNRALWRGAPIQPTIVLIRRDRTSALSARKDRMKIWELASEQSDRILFVESLHVCQSKPREDYLRTSELSAFWNDPILQLNRIFMNNFWIRLNHSDSWLYVIIEKSFFNKMAKYDRKKKQVKRWQTNDYEGLIMIVIIY